MSATRLTFLYPHLLRSARSSGAQVATQQPWAVAAFYEGATNSATSATAAATWASRRSVSSVRSRSKSSFAPRHGKAVSPAEWEEQQKQQQKEDGEQEDQQPQEQQEQEQQQQQQQQPVVAPEEQPQTTVQDIANPASREQDTKTTIRASTTMPEKATDGVETEIASAAAATSAQPASATSESSGGGAETSEAEAKADETDEEARSRQNRESAKHSGPLEAVMHMQPPEHVAQQHPSMSPPPYVHHFDSYSLVKQLEAGGYSREQAVTSMKAIRKLLAKHLDVAQQSLVSKSDVENETYLFSAACSELSTEIKNNRRLQDEQVRQERTHLQHEVDILTQSLNQELLTLNDATRGMFNDRKMAAREEQKAAESAIQKINYKISILLTSDAKTDIEGVRWILIRRSVLGIIFMAILTLGTLRYATYVGQQRKLEAEQKKKEEEEIKEEIKRNGGPKKDTTDGVDAVEILASN